MATTPSAVQATNDDATECKLSAIMRGYWSDDFVRHFVARAGAGEVKKGPLINRGHFARVATVDSIVRHFLDATTACGSSRRQVVVFGAGFDTTFLRLWQTSSLAAVSWFEIDLPDVVRSKIATLCTNPVLRSTLGGDGVALRSDDNAMAYHWPDCGLTVAAADLRDITQVERALGTADRSLPTLFVSEVVLVYVDPA
jgi:O-methyltransferase involved in polyketide biosynthesis